jgi:hypothetical protein
MKKISILLVTGIISCWVSIVSAQSSVTYAENFDSDTISVTINPSSSWEKDANYYVSPPFAFLGTVPNLKGNVTVLETSAYDFTQYEYVLLRFKHICKISPLDIVRLEYRISGQIWSPIPAYTYLGKAMLYQIKGFSAASYPEWQENDSLALPMQSWWKEECFDLSFETRYASGVQFRFIIQHTTDLGTQISYGWLLDNIEITAANHDVKPPVIEFVRPFIRDTVYGTGPWEIKAKMATATTSPLQKPYLKFTATENGNIVAIDSVLMTNIDEDSLWIANIPQFVPGTKVTYSITGKDTLNNYTVITSDYVIKRVSASGTTGSVTIGSGTTQSNVMPFYIYRYYSWNRHLYLASELDNMTSAGGIITKLAWDYASTTTSIRTNQTCYFQAVDDTVINSTAYIDPVSADATQVWSGSISLAQGWCEITLDQPFLLPPGKHLLIYWEHKPKSIVSSVYFNTHSTGTANRSVYYGYNATNFETITSSAGELSDMRPNARFYILASLDGNNSAAMHSIDMKDTMATAPGLLRPIVVTLKNKGLSNLTSADIYYSINGETPPKQYQWNGNLSWDFNGQDTIGYYTSVSNSYDTITVWIKSPNGQSDNTTRDDTLTNIIYNHNDIFMEFIDYPRDTVYFTGPYEISVHIYTIRGQLLEQYLYP